MRKAHQIGSNIRGTDHGYIEFDENDNEYCRLVRAAYVEDPYREQVGG